MRSAVSAILSAPSPESNMSHPDYNQIPHDHSALLVMVKHIGSKIDLRHFSRLYERISRYNVCKIKDSNGTNRNILVRYVRSYSAENNQWGDFQTHRKLLGLLCIGECSSVQDVSELYKIHDSLKTKFGSTLYDSRCIFLGMQADGIPFKSEISSSQVTPEEESSSSVHHEKLQEVTSRSQVDTEKHNSTAIKVPHASHSIFYPSIEQCFSLEKDLQEFISSLFWVLESKRLAATSNLEKDRLPFLCAPFERKDLIGVDLESRTHRKRSAGRWRKHVADLTFQAGLFAEAFEHYQLAVEALRPVNDWLWLAGALEGLCSTSAIHLYPKLRRPVPLQRNGSLTEEGFRSNKAKISAGHGGGLHSLPVDVGGLHGHGLMRDRGFLGPDDILEKYHEAVVHYSKYRNAGVIETEASIKAVQILIEERKYLSAAEFLQNVVFINLQLADDEKIQRFFSLSELYLQLDFKRKSAFFRRIAAMRCVAPAITIQPNWQLCYHYLLDSLNGYKLSLDPTGIPLDSIYGWPALQVQVLQELTGTAKRMGNVPLAIRHASLLLHLILSIHAQKIDSLMSAHEQTELAHQIELFSQRSDSQPLSGPLALDNGAIVPPVQMTLLPKVLNMKLQPPSAEMMARKLKNTEENSSGPFLFTPIQRGSFRNKPNLQKPDFEWVSGDRCEVSIMVYNASPFELHVTNMQLITEDVVFESEPVAFTLSPCSPQSRSTEITLAGIPKTHGTLKILGYSMTVLGLKSNCKLKSAIPNMKVPYIAIPVVPGLPRLSVQLISHLNNSKSTRQTENFLSIFAGESVECNLQFFNDSVIPIDYFDMEVTYLSKPSAGTVLDISLDNLKTQLPWAAGHCASATVYVNGVSDFVVNIPNDSCSVSDDIYSVPSLLGQPSIHSRMTSFYGSVANSRNAPPPRTLEQVHSIQSGASSARSYESNFQVNSSEMSSLTPVSAVLKFQYSGGSGLSAGLCRVSNLNFNVEIKPSLVITGWDVLPAESPTHCYLVLDILNATHQEMELNYSLNKFIAIEALDSCRVPVPVERCPLSKLQDIYTDTQLNSEQRLQKISLICSEHLTSLVELKWILSSANNSLDSDGQTNDSGNSRTVKGKSTLTGLKISAPVLDLLYIPPLQMELHLNNEIWMPERSGFSCVIGDPVDISVFVFNALSTDLGPVKLQLSIHQEMVSGSSQRKSDARLIISGSDCSFVAQVRSNTSFEHKCKALFLSPGTFKLDATSALLTSSNDELGYHETSIRGDHVWRFLPSIEITVTES